jgi:hypothetical protein
MSIKKSGISFFLGDDVSRRATAFPNYRLEDYFPASVGGAGHVSFKAESVPRFSFND